jgi:hypothetical protein
MKKCISLLNACSTTTMLPVLNWAVNFLCYLMPLICNLFGELHCLFSTWRHGRFNCVKCTTLLCQIQCLSSSHSTGAWRRLMDGFARIERWSRSCLRVHSSRVNLTAQHTQPCGNNLSWPRIGVGQRGPCLPIASLPWAILVHALYSSGHWWHFHHHKGNSCSGPTHQSPRYLPRYFHSRVRFQLSLVRRIAGLRV